MLTLRAKGLNPKEIAHRLGISERSVHGHFQRAYERLDARDLVDAFRLLGWLRV